MYIPCRTSSLCVLLSTMLLLLVILPTSHSLATSGGHRQLSVDYYSKSCPQLDQLVGSITSQQFKQAPVTAPATIRLFFHDCFVEGCDGSVLISTKPGSKELAEKDAQDNKELTAEAFESINKAKALVENKCPGVVSCADILAVAARDYVHLAGGPYYQVKKGRWDGKISMASRVYANIPHANSTIDDLLKLFSSKGLTPGDLVVLSGAHSIGFAHCKNFVNRLYDYRGTKQPDPSVDPRLLKALKMSCPQYGGNTDIVAPFDVTTPFLFDNAYYQNLESKLGLLATDQALFLDPRTKPMVQDMASDKQKFFQAFALAMEKMGSIGVKRGRKHGEKRSGVAVAKGWGAESSEMKAVVQRVASASVEVEGRTVSSIGPGLLVLVGLHDSDVDSDADYICRKVLNMRLFPNQNTGKTWDHSVMQKNYEVLLVSQFTLYGILKGNKPDFHVAMSPDRAKPFYASLVDKFQKAYKPDVVKDGIFGAMMKVNLVNDGPVTMQLDSSQSSK